MPRDQGRRGDRSERDECAGGGRWTGAGALREWEGGEGAQSTDREDTGETAAEAGGPQGTAPGHPQCPAGAETAWPPATASHPDLCPDRSKAPGGVGTPTGGAGLRTAPGAAAPERAGPGASAAAAACAVATRP